MGMNDLIHRAMYLSCQSFGERGDNIFTAAWLSIHLGRMAGLSGATLDGHMVAAILCGRPDVEPLDSCHYRFIPNSKRPTQ